MADVKISQLPTATTPLDGSEVLPIVQSATTKQVSIANVTAGRAMSASSLTLTTPLAVTSGGTGLAVGTSGGVPYFNSTTGMASSAALAANQLVIGGGAGAAPATTTTGTGVLTFLGTPSSANLAAAVTDETGTGSLVFGTSPTFTTSALFPAGTVSAPGIAASGNTNTGVYFPAANSVAIATNGTAALTADSSQNVSVTGTLAMGSSFLRNKIINGAMRIAQRGTTAVTVNGAYPVDRWVLAYLNDGAMSAISDTDAPSGFTNSIKYTTTTADGSLSANQYACAYQLIEGYNSADLAFGTSSAKTITVSFWVKSSLTGTFGGVIGNGAFTRSYPFTYTINSASTWEYKTVTIAGDTTGTWATDNTAGMMLIFGLGAGSSVSGTVGSWAGSNFISATGAVSVIGTLNATWAVTGVQLEVGSVATPFERRLYTHELQLCKRYYWRATGSATGAAGFPTIAVGNAASATQATVMFPWTDGMRIPPTLGYAGNISVYEASAAPFLTAVTTTYGVTGTGLTWALLTAAGGGLTGGRGILVYAQNASTNWFEGNSEL